MRTPLYEIHRRLSARMAEFAGWEMPIQYTGILEEHRRTREGCAVFDTCHMGEIELRGAGALADLERLITSRVAALSYGQCRYGYLLREDGGVLDDLTCYRFGADRWWLVVNAGTRQADAEWVAGHVSPGTQVADRSDEIGKLDVQGPASCHVMEQVLGRAPPTLGYFRFAETEWEGVPIVISRSGYTGEWGYEIYLPAERTADLWERLVRAGATPAGLGARDTLRLEMGYPLYGHELSTHRTPVAAARGAFIDLNKDFIGKPAVERDLAAGCPRYLAGLALSSRRAARAGDTIRRDGRIVGEVTSGSYGPSVGTALALAYLDRELTVEGSEITIEARGTSLPARVSRLPFWTRGTARAAQPPEARPR